MTTLDIFQYVDYQLRTVDVDGEPWFIAQDVAVILEYSATSAMTRRLDAEDKGVRDLHTLGGEQQFTIISEAGLYVAIFGSQSRNAQGFKRHVTHNILPTIRKTGSYQAPTGTNLLALAVIEAQQMLEASARQVAELTPRAEAWDELASATGDYEVADAAKMLARAGVETGRQRLFGQLKGLGWIYRPPSGKWKARQSAVDAGYLAEKPQSHHHPRTGELVLDPPQVRVTVRGLERLRVRLGRVVALEVAS
jgi:prophage antirepressor-like protein